MRIVGFDGEKKTPRSSNKAHGDADGVGGVPPQQRQQQRKQSGRFLVVPYAGGKPKYPNVSYNSVRGGGGGRETEL